MCLLLIPLMLLFLRNIHFLFFIAFQDPCTYGRLQKSLMGWTGLIDWTKVNIWATGCKYVSLM